MIDLIGDIHGHADQLEALLRKLGYEKNNGVYAHPARTVLFVGDYIDRGPKIRESLHIVRSMVENGQAVALMGNHEYNALCFHFQESEGGHLRKHLIKNIMQHYETLKQFHNRQSEYEDYLEWFKTLPLYYETNQFRAVHACWDNKVIANLRSQLVNDRLTDDLIYKSVVHGSPLNRAIDQTLKGKELTLPTGVSFADKDGTLRSELRMKWWIDLANASYKSISVEDIETLTDRPIDLSLLNSADYYQSNDKMVFFGHYWLNGTPKAFKSNVCCLDYSVAKHGKLVAYRLYDEQTIQNENLVWVE